MVDNENVESQQQPDQENKPKFDDVLEQAKTVEPEKDESSIAEEPLPQDAINIVIMTHLLGLIGFIGPLIVWLLKKDEHKFINEQVREILNYQLSLMIYLMAGILLCLIVIGVAILPVLMILHIVFVIIATVKASEGKAYHYPIAIQFLK